MSTMTYDEFVTAHPTWSRLTDRLGRNDLPGVLMRNWFELEPAELAYAISMSWSAAEYPERLEVAKDWKAIMRHAGFIVDGALAERPSGPVRLWRGATPEGMRGMAWSTSRETAEWFRDRLISPFGLDGRLWTAEVTPTRLLMACSDRDENELVINTTGLEIQETTS